MHKTNAIERKVIFDRNLLNNERIIKEIIINSSFSTNEDNAEQIVKKFSKTSIDVLKDLNVIREVKVIEKKFMLSRIIKKKIKEKSKIAKLVRKCELPRIKFTKIKKLIKKKIIQFRKQRYINYIKKGIDYLRNNDYRTVWRWIKTQSNLNKKIGSNNCGIKDNDTGLLEYETSKKLAIWENHFSMLSKKEDGLSIEMENINVSEISNIMSAQIAWEEVEFELKCTRKNKAASADLIPSEFYQLALKDKESIFSQNLLILLNKVYEEGCCPKEWEAGIIVPIFKKGDKSDVNNYRGITIINTLQKLLAKVLARRLQVVCNEYGLIRKEQVGFISEGECTSQIVTLLECCQRRRIIEKNTILCFLDLRKAYDLVSHELLLKKLKNKGLGNKFINFIGNMYSNTKMQVRCDNMLSNSFEYQRGVRQGCPTSPLLFNIFIDDLLDNIEPVEVEGLECGLRGLMFADDTVVVAKDYNDLKDKLKLIEEWMKNNLMEVNPAKSGIMVIKGNNDIGDNEVIYYNNEELPKVNRYTYLGVELNNELDLKKMADFRKQKGVAVSNILTPSLSNPEVPLEFKRMLVNNVIAPMVSYGVEVFGLNETRLQKLKV